MKETSMTFLGHQILYNDGVQQFANLTGKQYGLKLSFEIAFPILLGLCFCIG